MSRPTLPLLVFTFAAGMVFATVVPVAAQPAPAKDHVEAAAVKWEYTCWRPRGNDDVVAALNGLGKQGWELSTADGSLYCFKRPLGG